MANIEKNAPLTCFTAYDVRGELGVNFDTAIAAELGRRVHSRAP